MLILTSLPASVLGLLLHSTIKSLFTPVSVALALFCGALLMLATEYYMSKHRGSGAEGASMDEITAKQIEKNFRLNAEGYYETILELLSAKGKKARK